MFSRGKNPSASKHSHENARKKIPSTRCPSASLVQETHARHPARASTCRRCLIQTLARCRNSFAWVSAWRPKAAPAPSGRITTEALPGPKDKFPRIHTLRTGKTFKRRPSKKMAGGKSMAQRIDSGSPSGRTSLFVARACRLTPPSTQVQAFLAVQTVDPLMVGQIHCLHAAATRLCGCILGAWRLLITRADTGTPCAPRVPYGHASFMPTAFQHGHIFWANISMCEESLLSARKDWNAASRALSHCL